MNIVLHWLRKTPQKWSKINRYLKLVKSTIIKLPDWLTFRQIPSVNFLSLDVTINQIFCVDHFEKCTEDIYKEKLELPVLLNELVITTKCVSKHFVAVLIKLQHVCRIAAQALKSNALWIISLFFMTNITFVINISKVIVLSLYPLMVLKDLNDRRFKLFYAV